MQSRGRSGSRRSSITKAKSRSRSGSAQGTFRVTNPSISLQEEQLRDAANALDEALKQLAYLRKGGLRKLPDEITKKINELRGFVV
ncbi:hypothetical protein NMY22_g18680 [Coprinellus aureogranulatus]|nr:hypothetical protein NMY22_g18680 [Coprinellus aureogranulatus]